MLKPSYEQLESKLKELQAQNEMAIKALQMVKPQIEKDARFVVSHRDIIEAVYNALSYEAIQSQIKINEAREREIERLKNMLADKDNKELWDAHNKMLDLKESQLKSLQSQNEIMVEAINEQIKWLKLDGAWHVHAKMQVFELQKALSSEAIQSQIKRNEAVYRLIEAFKSFSAIRELNENNYNADDLRELQNDMFRFQQLVGQALSDLEKLKNE